MLMVLEDAPERNGDTKLTIDPALIWSTLLGGRGDDFVYATDVDVGGVVTVAGETLSADFPTSSGAYDASHNGMYDAFVSRLDPSKPGSAQLTYSTFLGASGRDHAYALFVDSSGVVAVAGTTSSPRFPTTNGAYDTTHNGGFDAFVCHLDPRKTGPAQLVYSTFLGGSGHETAYAMSRMAGGVMSVAGSTSSPKFPTSAGAYGTSNNGRDDAFVSRLDPRKTGSAQLVYSTLLGGRSYDGINGLAVDQSGIVTVVGDSYSQDFPTSAGAFDKSHNGNSDAFASRLDPSKTGKAQLVYSTLLGESGDDSALALGVDASGVVTLAGRTGSSKFPTSSGAYDTSHNGWADAFVSRLDPSKTGNAQLVYSTFLGGVDWDYATTLSNDPDGILTVAGTTASPMFPTTKDALDRGVGWPFSDAFITRLDPSKTGKAQLVYSTFLGWNSIDYAQALAVDASGTAIVAGSTAWGFFPTTANAYLRFPIGGKDIFVSRISMDSSLWADKHELSLRHGGTQTLTLDAGKEHANNIYFLLGSLGGTKPGIPLNNSLTLPLLPDAYFMITLAYPNAVLLTGSFGKLDAAGRASAKFTASALIPPGLVGSTFHHAYVVIGKSQFDMASNAVPLTLVK